MKIGLIGLGRMGGGMAGCLLAARFDLRVFDRDPKQTDALSKRGAYVASSVADLCVERDLVITMLPTDQILEDVSTGIGGLVDALPRGAIHMVSGTHGVGVMEKLIAAHANEDQILVSCTVLGRPDRAAEGKLGLIPAGPAAAIKRVTPALEVMGDSIFNAGPNPLSAVAAKIANNLVLGCAIEAMGEGMAQSEKYGLDPELFCRILTEGLFNCVAYQGYGDVIAKQDWGRIGATAAIGLKDAELALEAAERVSIPLPSCDVWHDHLLSACGRGESSLDWAVMAREQFRRSGLE